MTNLELIFFAGVALFFAYKLWSVLGKTNGQEQARAAETTARAEKRAGGTVTPKTIELKAEKAETPEIIPAHLEDSVKKIKQADKSFTLTGFTQLAEDSFESVIKNFSKQNSDELKRLLAPEVFKGFEEEIRNREIVGEEHLTSLISMARPEILSAELEGNTAQIVVKFLSEQVRLVKNKAGEIIAGGTSVIDHVTDIWTFERDLAAKKSGWVVAGIQYE